MLAWGSMLVILLFVTVVLLLYALVTRSAGIYQSSRQFWIQALVSLGVMALVSEGLFLAAHVSVLAAVIISAVVPFVVSSVVSRGDTYGLNEQGDGEEEEREEDEELNEESVTAVEVDEVPKMQSY